MNKPHKHAELIKAWANGAEIEYSNIGGDSVWISVSSPRWDGYGTYRIKPEPKPDIVEVRTVACSNGMPTTLNNLKLTFDGETGKLKFSEVI